MPRKADGKVHQSDLKAIAQSPAHYRWQIDHPRDDSPAMRIGRAIHALYLQGIEPVVFDGKRSTKGYAEFVAPLGDAAEDVLIVSERDTVLRMRDALIRDTHATEILSRCPEREVSIEWELMGLPCAGRLDLRGSGVLADLKSCRCAHPRKFLWEAENKFHYDAQLPWYDVAGGIRPIGPDTQWSDQYLIAVENVAPYNVLVYQLDPLRIDQGWSKIVEWMQILNSCLKSGKWPGYLEGVRRWDGQITTHEDDEEEGEIDA